jgi:3-hydroxyisobutyrate dehydrogenase-like beta-hydroxyacid dehydrogenase
MQGLSPHNGTESIMKVGFLGFGEVASNLAQGLKAERAEVYTCLAGRSSRTVELAESVGVSPCSTNQEVCEISDIVLSTVVPSQAINVAKEVGSQVKGVYVDLNNVSPFTVREALKYISSGKTADASIMGSINRGLNVPIIASGKYAPDFAELKRYGMNIEVIGDEIGQASAVKMFRSVYTKGVSALLFESLYAAYKMGVDDVVLHYLAETEGHSFRDSATSRLKSSALHGERRVQEMEEVVKFLSDTDPQMSHATLEFFRSLPGKIGPITKKPANYREIFRRVDEKRE